jgi:hypothetical protein
MSWSTPVWFESLECDALCLIVIVILMRSASMVLSENRLPLSGNMLLNAGTCKLAGGVRKEQIKLIENSFTGA